MFYLHSPFEGRQRWCRDAFVAPEGRVLLSADYAQMELRLMAHLSGDESLCAALADPNQDPFTQWAAQWLRVKPITAVCHHTPRHQWGLSAPDIALLWKTAHLRLLAI